ncbi:cobalt ABC transporter permease [Georgenia sp. 311]|uniref:Cobalt ABC transporter permease n=1 Tax=Georgenia wutianyii TaxID=2585135 RepID=A0ABX5VPG3_9MICO|nr:MULTISPECIES: PDGLE domain-containing protein [Georgenia]QDB79268.1 cobalt ABC transporter permease [Georgenia wutianyii]TNC18934.1 cobalt ABC transporter permease [Georgenia sp. 311]
MSAQRGRRRISARAFTVGALTVALLVACVVSVWASGHPDGLEYVAESEGFIGEASESAAAASPFADYSVAGLPTGLSVAIVGLVGCAVTFAVAWGVGRLTRGRTRER